MAVVREERDIRASRNNRNKTGTDLLFSRQQLQRALTGLDESTRASEMGGRRTSRAPFTAANCALAIPLTAFSARCRTCSQGRQGWAQA